MLRCGSCGSPRAANLDDKRKRLQEEVEVQQRRVDRLAESMDALGNSDRLTRKVRDVEARLLDMKQALASTVAPKQVEPAPVATKAQVMTGPTAIQGLAATTPVKARDAGTITERLVLTPGPDGYRARLTLRNYPAALSGGRVDVVGCGGRI